MSEFVILMFLVLAYDPVAWLFAALFCICLWAHDRETRHQNVTEVTLSDWEKGGPDAF